MMFPFLKRAVGNLFSDPSTEQFPNFEARGLGKYRGRIAFDGTKCTNCGNCIRVCSPIAITTKEEAVEGGKYVTRYFDLTSCTFCQTCADFCDEGAITMTNDYHMVAEDPKDLIVSGTAFIKDIAGHISIDQSGCIYCGLCARNCPQQTIKVDRASKTWKIDLEQCVKCGICVGRCPRKVLSFEDKPLEPQQIWDREAEAAAAAEAAKKPQQPVNSIGSAEGGSGLLTCRQDGCIYCGLCARNCPQGAITVDRGSKTWSVDHDQCIECGICISKCPKKVLSFGDQVETPAPAPKAEEPKAEAKPAAAPAPAAKPVDTSDVEEFGLPKGRSEAESGQIQCNLDACIYCGICAKNCPVGALTVDRATKSWSIDQDSCVQCGLCTEKCPKKALSFKD
jgi:formate hydrogenlyase subunit 6/NADH:ubiquinone oxidoreductase subunit I